MSVLDRRTYEAASGRGACGGVLRTLSRPLAWLALHVFSSAAYAETQSSITHSHHRVPPCISSGCLPGYGGPGCTICARGFYSAGGGSTAATRSNCTACPAGQRRFKQHAAGCPRAVRVRLACVVSWMLRTGRAPIAATNQCGRRALTHRSLCASPARRDAGSNTTAAGATAISACVNPNTCRPGTGGASCSACLAGTYSAGGDASVPKRACTNCPSGFTTLSTNSTSAAACNGEPFLRLRKLGLWAVCGRGAAGSP